MKMDSLTRFAIGVGIALALLLVYNRQKIDMENAALGSDNQAAFEEWQGHRITAPRPSEIETLIGEARTRRSEARANVIVWLGNSQLHTINQYRRGDHLAPHWLAEEAKCDPCIEPLGLSLPNANFQEYLVMAQYAVNRLPVSLLVVKLVFDKLREDGLRDELAPLVTDDVRETLSKSDIGREMIDNWDGRHAQAATGENKQHGLEGFMQKPLEDGLDRLFSNIPLWAERGNLRGHFMLDLFHARNIALGIKPNSLRRMIPGRYARNMRALDQIIALAHSSGIPLLVYVAPIRNDVPLPYDAAAYGRWKNEIEAMAKSKNFAFMNLESLVPNDRWGAYVADEIDFMHFQGRGHQLLAAALWPELRRLLSSRGPALTAGKGSQK